MGGSFHILCRSSLPVRPAGMNDRRNGQAIETTS